jgi:hypothetical protein
MENTRENEEGRSEGMTGASRSALANPAFLAALAVLLINDHVLKGAGLLPGWLTGKLSDLAGLIVAPVLAAVVLRARAPRARVLAFALVAIPFALTKMSDLGARAMESAAGSLGIEWRIWTDPTDLIALAMLPLAWRLLDAPMRAGRALQHAVVIAGALACVASSTPVPGPTWSTSAYAANVTSIRFDLRVRWIDGDLECTAIRGSALRALAPTSFDSSGITFTLDPNATIPLERAAALTAAGMDASMAGPTRPCDAVLMQADGMPDTIVFWFNDAVLAVPTNLAGDTTFTLGRGAVELRGGGPTTRATLHEGTEGGDALRVVPESSCSDAEAQAFQWSLAEPGSFMVVAVEPGVDGCVGVDLAPAGGGDAVRSFICIPVDLFPFAPGDLVTVDDTSLMRAFGNELRISGTAAELVVISQTVEVSALGVAGTTMVMADCDGVRRDCGAYVQASMLELSGGTTVRAGERVAVAPDARGWAGEVAVGQSWHVVVARDGCETSESVVGTGTDVVIVRREGM